MCWIDSSKRAACSAVIGSGNSQHYLGTLIETVDEANGKPGKLIFDELGTVESIGEANVDRHFGATDFKINGEEGFIILVGIAVDGFNDALNKTGGFFQHFFVLHFYGILT